MIQSLLCWKPFDSLLILLSVKIILKIICIFCSPYPLYDLIYLSLTYAASPPTFLLSLILAEVGLLYFGAIFLQCSSPDLSLSPPVFFQSLLTSYERGFPPPRYSKPLLHSALPIPLSCFIAICNTHHRLSRYLFFHLSSPDKM